MTPSLDEAALKHTSVKVKANQPPPCRIIFMTLKSGQMDVQIKNSSVRINQEQLKDISEMMEVLKAENKIGTNGSMLLSQLEKM